MGGDFFSERIKTAVHRSALSDGEAMPLELLVWEQSIDPMFDMLHR